MLDAKSTIVVVGAGQAGFQTALTLREQGFEGRVVLLGEEDSLPYQRPPLSKAYLNGGVLDAKLQFRPGSFFAERRVELRTSSRVVQIDRLQREVGLASGEILAYDHLVLSTGARPRLPAWPGAQLEGVLLLRTLQDAQRVRAILQTASSVVVIGAGFIGLEVAAAARTAGRAVTVIELADRVLKRAVSREMASHIEHSHADHGVRFVMQANVAAIEGVNGQVAAVVTSSGLRVDADAVVVGIGVQPNTELAQAANLLVNDGVVVDEHLQTSDPKISAIGDCARYPSLYAGGSVRLESVQNSIDHGRLLAQQLSGKPATGLNLPRFWSDQGDLRLQICGLANEDDESMLRGDPESGKFSVLRFRGERLTAIESLNHPAEHAALRKVLETGALIDRKKAAAPQSC